MDTATLETPEVLDLVYQYIVDRPHLRATPCIDCKNGNHTGYCSDRCGCLCGS